MILANEARQKSVENLQMKELEQIAEKLVIQAAEQGCNQTALPEPLTQLQILKFESYGYRVLYNRQTGKYELAW